MLLLFPAPSACSSNPCVHGQCQNSGTSYTCQCNSGFTGTNCNMGNLITDLIVIIT